MHPLPTAHMPGFEKLACVNSHRLPLQPAVGALGLARTARLRTEQGHLQQWQAVSARKALCPLGGRFAAAAGLAMKLEGHPHKQALLDALAQRRLSGLEAFLEHFMNELLITGARCLLSHPAMLAHA